MRAAFLALTLLATTAHAAPKLWGGLEGGPYAVGYRVLERYDHARPFRARTDLAGKPRSGERARPMQVSVWYPAEATNAKRMLFRDYLALAEENAFFAFPLLRDLTAAQRERLKALDTAAVRDAKPLARTFPLVVWSLHLPALSHSTPEYLASHGYVVVTMPRVGATSGAPPEGRDVIDQDTKLRDIEFLIREMASFPSADVTNIGAIGFSAGGRWMPLLAMKNPDVRAVVSLDSIMLFKDAWPAVPWLDPDALRVPVMHMIRSDWVPREDPELWRRMRYADRTYIELTTPGIDHLDFQTAGLATTLAGARANIARDVLATHDTFNRYTRAFLDAHLKNDANARAFLAQPAPPSLKITHTPAEPAPITLAQFQEAVREDGVDAALAALRAPLPEPILNATGYFLLFQQGRPHDALKLFQANVAAYASSANAHDSVADAYEAAGDKQRAIEESQKALALLDAYDATPERKKAIRDNIEARLRRLRNGG